ncbi:MAG: N-acetylmuramyl-L-alanine amidase, negative regulator of AmpC, AmpD [Verrucomicrobiaceae bacterium]|nr:N-acetylmuramyl-L-alanine amidase, negative regulator of AmpC, AmpD [Verrucomicrobiaceae bacterium]
MTIDENHWLKEARRDVLPGGAVMNTRCFLVMHFTSGASAQSSVDFWKSPDAQGACAHVIIDRDGSIIQCRPFNRTCGHAGKSTWKGLSGLNACSIGIELANAGDDEKLAKRWSKLPLVQASHKNGGPAQSWEAYSEAQLVACTAVSQALVKRYNLDDVVGHDDIAPKRKNDPGPAFPMQALREACGFSGMP